MLLLASFILVSRLCWREELHSMLFLVLRDTVNISFFRVAIRSISYGWDDDSTVSASSFYKAYLMSSFYFSPLTLFYSF